MHRNLRHPHRHEGRGGSELPTRRVIILLSLLAVFPFLTVSPPHGLAEQEVIRVGVATSLSTIEGEESCKAVRLAAEEINRQGGIRLGMKKLPIRVDSIDLRDALPETSVSEALSSFKKFFREMKPDAVLVGPFRSEVLLAGMEMIAQEKIPLLCTIAMSSASESMIMRDPNLRNIFRVALDYKYLVDYLISTMKFLNKKFGFRKVFIIHQDVAWARATASLMVRLFFDRAGWEVVGIESFPTGTSDFSRALNSAREGGCDVILPVFDMPQSGELVKQWHLARVPALLCGFISPMVGPQAWSKFNGQIAGALNVVFELGNVPSNRYPPAARFYKAYKQRYGREIEAGHGPAPSYESVYILKDAVEKAGVLDPNRVIPALEVTDRAGTMGRIRFHQGHQVIFGKAPESEALACVIQWTEEGNRKIVYPTSIADGEIELPPFLQWR